MCPDSLSHPALTGTNSPVSDINVLLDQVGDGCANSLNRLYEAVYAELHTIATSKLVAERPGHTLQATALVNEAYLRLLNSESRTWENKAHFFFAAAEAMRRILVESARRHRTLKRGGENQRIELDEARIAVATEDERLLQVHDALDELAREDPLKAEIVKLRYFVGLNHQQIADALGVNEKTVRRHWALSKVRLYTMITGAADPSAAGPLAT